MLQSVAMERLCAWCLQPAGGDSSKGTCQHPMEWHYASEVGEKGLGPALGCKGHLEVES